MIAEDFSKYEKSMKESHNDLLIQLKKARK
jgi:hypothetical protein